MAIKAKVSRGGRVVIPSAYRQALGIDVGDDVVISLDEGTLRISTLAQAIE
jgi:AbrB family looped-hinge helix DNA binding protein